MAADGQRTSGERSAVEAQMADTGRASGSSQADCEASAGTQRKRPGRKPRTSIPCQVPGCGVELIEEKAYLKRYKICAAHCYADSVELGGHVSRFCQQCGRFQPLEDFKGCKRSCEHKLKRHNELRFVWKERKRAKRAAVAAGSSGCNKQADSAEHQPSSQQQQPPSPPRPPQQQALQPPPAQQAAGGGSAAAKRIRLRIQRVVPDSKASSSARTAAATTAAAAGTRAAPSSAAAAGSWLAGRGDEAMPQRAASSQATSSNESSGSHGARGAPAGARAGGASATGPGRLHPAAVPAQTARPGPPDSAGKASLQLSAGAAVTAAAAAAAAAAMPAVGAAAPGPFVGTGPDGSTAQPPALLSQQRLSAELSPLLGWLGKSCSPRDVQQATGTAGTAVAAHADQLRSLFSVPSFGLSMLPSLGLLGGLIGGESQPLLQQGASAGALPDAAREVRGLSSQPSLSAFRQLPAGQAQQAQQQVQHMGPHAPQQAQQQQAQPHLLAVQQLPPQNVQHQQQAASSDPPVSPPLLDPAREVRAQWSHPLRPSHTGSRACTFSFHHSVPAGPGEAGGTAASLWGVAVPALAAAAAAAGDGNCGSSQLDLAIQKELLCPITGHAMRDPVVAADGCTYERAAIETWIKAQQAQGQQPCSPVTQKPLGDLSLRPNQLARALAEGLRAAGLLPY